jgi:hypothetical protein
MKLYSRALGLFLPLALACALLPGRAAADDGVPVPNLTLPGAAFAPSGKPAAGQRPVFVASGEDGARLVAFEAALLTAVIGSRVELAAAPTAEGEQPAALSLLQGAYHVVTGSKPVDLKLGRATIRASRAELLVAQLGQAWVVRILERSEGGKVVALPQESPQPAPAPAEPATDEDEPEAATPIAAAPAPEPDPAVELEPGTSYTIRKGRPPLKADRRATQLLDKTNERLLPQPGPQTTLLEPRDITDPSDFSILGGVTDDALADIELEDIEVEVGCVEICVD